jgi:SAM-dependent methyltransferase
MKEADIRPQAIFDEYLRLCAEDTRTYFGTGARAVIPCPACGAHGDRAFDKNGFTYELCGNCDTLYVSPRPSARAFAAYYQTAPSSKFWASTFYPGTAEARRRLLWQPKARVVAAKLRALDAASHSLVDIGGGYGLFAEEIRSLIAGEVLIIEPAPHLAEVCRGRSLRVIQKFLEDVEVADLPGGGKAFTSFELFEHLHDPRQFLSRLLRLMAPGDLFLFTTLSGTGLDIRLLWERSKSVSPPHHLNFVNPRSVSLLLASVGFNVLEVTTPGALDIDILANSGTLISDRFWKAFFEHADEHQKQAWQAVISSTGWSSHMMVMCERPRSGQSAHT